MPRKVTRWACEFGCGRAAVGERERMERHERTCFSSPARRACKTCKHELREDGDWYCEATGGPGEAGGWLDDPAWLESRRPGQADAFRPPPSDKSAWPPRVRWDCPGWEAA